MMALTGATGVRAAEPADAAALLERGLQQLEAGEFDQARATLQRVDATLLSPDQNAQLQDGFSQLMLRHHRTVAQSAAQPTLAAQDEGAEGAAETDAGGPVGDAAEGAPPATGETLIRQARTLRAQQLIAQADEAANSGQYNRAAQLYEEALRINAENPEAKRGLETVQALLGRDTGSRVLGDFGNIAKLRREQALARYDDAMTHAREQLAQGNYPTALDTASLAKAILDSNRQFLTQAEYSERVNVVQDFAAKVQVDQENATARRQAEQAEQIAEQERLRRIRAEEERERKVQELLRRAYDLRTQMQLEQSLDVLDQLLFLEPNNIAALAMRDMIEDSIIYRNSRDITRRRSLAIARQSVDNMEATIPTTDLIQYPPDWPQLTQQRRLILGEGGGETQANRVVMEKLKQPIPVSFEDNRLENVVEYLRNVTGVDFFVNWRALEGAGIEPGTTVNMQLQNVPADKALRLILDQVGGDLVPLGFTIDDGVVTISTLDNLGRNTVIRTYDIRDLVVQAPNFTEAPDFDLVTITEGGSTEGGGGSDSLFEDVDEDDGLLGREELITQIMDLVRDTVDPDNWRENGGLVSSMSELNGSLIINTTSQNHREILSLLGQLRETRALQINVEARFLLVDQNYLDEVGIDIDMVINGLSTALSPIAVNQNSIDIAQRQNTTLTGSFGAAPGAPPGGAEGAFQRGRTSSGTFLSDIQVSFLIRATKANRRSISLSAPRITFFNGQRAYVLVSTQLAYVSDLDPLVGTSSAAFDPEISVVSSGVILDVQGTVSADRRYVTLTARPSLARVLRLRQVGVAGGGGIDDDLDGQLDEDPINGQDDDGDGAIDEDPPNVNTGGGSIEAPELELTTVRTTVSVPDRGTLLLGGQRLFAEIEMEAGVPVLSAIPGLNRLFTNRSIVKDERTLLILIKPTILIQSEKENELFPGLNQSSDIFTGG